MRRFVSLLFLSLAVSLSQAQSPSDIIFTELDLIEQNAASLQTRLGQQREKLNLYEVRLQDIETMLRSESENASRLETLLEESDSRSRFWKTTTITLAGCLAIESLILTLLIVNK